MSEQAKEVPVSLFNLISPSDIQVLAYMGLPLQIFGFGSFFSPYTPLQQLDFLSSPVSKSYIAGSTNTLFLAQRDLSATPESSHRYCDIIINLDEPSLTTKITILDPALRQSLSLSAADRRWIDHLTSTVLDTWNSADPSRPTTHGFTGSEDAIRLSFEEYLLSLLSSTAYKTHSDNHPNPYLSTSSGITDERYADPNETSNDFNTAFLSQWNESPNYRLWQSLTRDAAIFDIVEPRHPTAGGLNIEDVQRRVGAAVAELNLDEKVRAGRETAGRAIEAGRERVGAGVARFWKEVEGFKGRREGSRGREENAKPEKHEELFDAEKTGVNEGESDAAVAAGWAATWRIRAAQVQRPNVDTTQVQAAARENAAKAGAYLSSWGSWARDKSKEWQESRQVGAKFESESKQGMVKTDEEAKQSGIPRRQVSAGAVAATKSVMQDEKK